MFANTLMLSVGAVMVAVIEVALTPVGVEKPAGVVMSRLGAPAASGWNFRGAVSVSGVKATGLVIMVPRVVSELVTVTLTVTPVRTFWKDWTASVVGFN